MLLFRPLQERCAFGMCLKGGLTFSGKHAGPRAAKLHVIANVCSLHKCLNTVPQTQAGTRGSVRRTHTHTHTSQRSALCKQAAWLVFHNTSIFQWTTNWNVMGHMFGFLQHQYWTWIISVWAVRKQEKHMSVSLYTIGMCAIYRCFVCTDTPVLTLSLTYHIEGFAVRLCNGLSDTMALSSSLKPSASVCSHRRDLDVVCFWHGCVNWVIHHTAVPWNRLQLTLTERLSDIAEIVTMLSQSTPPDTWAVY